MGDPRKRARLPSSGQQWGMEQTVLCVAQRPTGVRALVDIALSTVAQNGSRLRNRSKNAREAAGWKAAKGGRRASGMKVEVFRHTAIRGGSAGQEMKARGKHRANHGQEERLLGTICPASRIVTKLKSLSGAPATL